MTEARFQGRFFEDFKVGDIYQHPVGRTITQADNIWFTLLTQNSARVHLDAHYAKSTKFGKPLVNSAMTLAIVTGQSVLDVSHNVFANLAWNDVRLPNPLFEGDTLYSSSEVVAVRPSASRPDVGIVTVRSTGFNQDGEVVISYERTLMVYRRDHAPTDNRPSLVGHDEGQP